MLARIRKRVPKQTPPPIIQFLDDRLFPGIIRYTIHRLHLSFLVVLWIFLLFGFLLPTQIGVTGGNYFNGLCGIVAVILLAQQGKHHKENMVHHRRTHKRLTALEKRAQQHDG